MMQSASRPVTSSQSGIHRQLQVVVARHASTLFRKPIAPWNQAAFEASVAAWRAAGEAPLILDAGCGIGLSTLHLAQQFPDHYVVGIDQSAHRLARNTAWPQPLPTNCIRLRAELSDYWRLLLAAGLRPARHYVLYPNPWPKIGQLRRRWHGHPVFPVLTALGGLLECRSNWRLYVEEWAAALTQLGHPAQCDPHAPETTITPFERKYLASGHALWRCQTRLP